MLTLQLALAATAVAAGLTSTWSPCGFSMVETIGRPPVGPWIRGAACTTFAVGALAGGVATFGGLALLGRLAHGTGGAVAAAFGSALLLAAAAAEGSAMRVVPQIRRQVPEPWRRVLPLPFASGLYGALLGLGFTTFVLTFAVWALAALSFGLGSPAIGALVGLAFGAGRSAPVLVLAPLVECRLGTRAFELMAERPSILRGFRAVAAACLCGAALSLSATSATAAVPVTIGGSDPSVAGGLLAWETSSGGLLGREPGAPDDPHGLGRGGLLQLPGHGPALGGAMLAFRVGATIRIEHARDLTPVAEIEVRDATALAVSDAWVVYRARGPRGDRIAARPLAEPQTERVLASVAAPAQLGRPAIASSAVVFHLADRRSSRILEVDLVTGRRRVLRRSVLDQLTNPSVEGGALLYVRQSNLRQVVQFGPRRPGGRDRTLMRLPAAAVRDDGFERGHSHVTLTPRAGPRSTRILWTTALGPRFAYVSVVPVARGGRPAILRMAR